MVQRDELVGVTFKVDWGVKEEVSVIVEDTLSGDSTMEDLMMDGDVIAELGADTNDLYKYLIQK